MDEIWVNIIGWEEYYQISSYGNYRSKDRFYCHRKGSMAFKKGIVLKPNYVKGYLIATLYRKDNGVERRERWPIHRLVAIHFIPNPNNKPTVNHIDTIKNNNIVSNLEWTTMSEQQYHAVKMGLRGNTLGRNSNLSKLDNGKIHKIRGMWATDKYSQREIAAQFGITEEHCHRIINRKSWKHI